MTLKETIDWMIEGLNEVVGYAESRLRTASSNLLYVVKRDGTNRYYEYDSTTGKRTYLGDDDADEIRMLEERDYCRLLLKAVEEERRALERVKAILEKLEGMPRWDSVFLRMKPERRHLIKPFLMPLKVSDEKLRAWARKDRWGRETGREWEREREPETLLTTSNGERVRSKSELVLAERYKAAGAPYEYETPLRLADRMEGRYVVLHPDFLVMNPRTGKVYYWEHLGMLDNPEYCANALRRLEVYADNGYYYGDNLILSAESSAHQMDMGAIDGLVERFLK